MNPHIEDLLALKPNISEQEKRLIAKAFEFSKKSP
jgi:hypothetical protein